MNPIPLLFGRYLVRTGRVTEAQVQRAAELQKELTPRIGMIAVLEGLLTVDDLRRIVEHQRRTGLLFREAVSQLGILDGKQLAMLEGCGQGYRVRLGEALLVQGSLSAAELQRALKDFEHYKISGELIRPAVSRASSSNGEVADHMTPMATSQEPDRER